MRNSAIAVLAVGVTAAALLTGCSSSGSKSGKSGGSTSGATSTSSGSQASGKAQVGVILPDTTSSTRYTEFDTPVLTKAFYAAGIKSDIQNAGGDKTKFASIAHNMISEGVKVLLIDSIDAPSGAAVESQAKTAGVKVIDYDRVNLGGSADYYVSFDNEKIGELQGQALLSLPQDLQGADSGEGHRDGRRHRRRQQRRAVQAGRAEGAARPARPSRSWPTRSSRAGTSRTLRRPSPRRSTATGGKVDGVYAANDDIANAVIGVLKSKGLAGKIPVTGQDSGVEGLRQHPARRPVRDDLQVVRTRGVPRRPSSRSR